MKRLLRQAAFSLAFSFALACVSCGGDSHTQPSSASSDSRSGTYMICYTESNAHGVTVSSVFHVPPLTRSLCSKSRGPRTSGVTLGSPVTRERSQ